MITRTCGQPPRQLGGEPAGDGAGRACLWVVAQRQERVVECLGHGEGEGIFGLGPVDGDHSDPLVVHLDEQRVGGGSGGRYM